MSVPFFHLEYLIAVILSLIVNEKKNQVRKLFHYSVNTHSFETTRISLDVEEDITMCQVLP